MDENAIRQWLIECFGQVQGEMAWRQISNLPEEIRMQLLSQDPSKLPKPDEVQALMQAFANGGLNTMSDMQRTVEEGPINVRLAKSIALQQANGKGSESTVNAETGQTARRAISEANLWLDTACQFDPVEGEMQVLTRADWVEGTLDAWAQFAGPVAQSMNDALASVISERLGDAMHGEVAGVFAGPVPIPIPDGMKDPGQLMRLLANTSFAMQLGRAAGAMSHEVRGSFDQGIALLKNPAGAIIAQNVVEYASSLDIPLDEVMAFIALQEAAHARLYAAVPWLMPRFEALIGKYARGITIDLDAMEEQLRDAGAMDPESLSGAVNLTKVGIPDTPEQQEALASLETLLALVEGWVDCVTWRAGMAHIPHIEQLREMLRRERATGGPAQRTFENLLGMHLRPKRMREAAAMWESIGAAEGDEARDGRWSHPDLLPALPGDRIEAGDAADAGEASTGSASGANGTNGTNGESADEMSIDWDAELSKLLDEGLADDAPADGASTGDMDEPGHGGTEHDDAGSRDADADGTAPDEPAAGDTPSDGIA